MFLPEQLLPAVTLAAGVAATVSAPALRWKGTSRTLVACAPAAGYFAGHILIAGRTSFPPTDTTNWLPYFAIAAAALGLLSSLVESKAARVTLLGLLCVGAMRLLLAPKFRYGWSPEQGWLWVSCLGCATLLLVLGIAAMARRPAIPMELPLILIIISAGIAGSLMLSGSLLLGLLAAVLSAAFLGSLVLAWRWRIDGDGPASVFSLVGVSLLACGYFFAELPALSAILLVAAPALALIPIGTPAHPCTAAARLALVAAAVGGAIYAAFHFSPPLI